MEFNGIGACNAENRFATTDKLEAYAQKAIILLQCVEHFKH